MASDLLEPTHAFGDAYHSDRIPVRSTLVPEGHAVRAIYLAAGATDVAVETGDAELLAALERQWEGMVARKMYVTGGLGSRWEGESFGDPYELPSDRAYAETCAAIAGMQWNWRLLLATGNPRYADLFERQFYNAVLPGVSLDGSAYFYANALHLRAGAVATDTRMAAAGRQEWFGCSCCPTNLMRTLASLHGYLASSTDEGVQLHQYASASLRVGEVSLAVQTDYPWSGQVAVTVEDSPSAAWTLQVRIPAWAAGAAVRVGDETFVVEPGTYASVRRTWRAGEKLVLDLPMAPRFTPGHPRVDSARGCVAIERGPLVYAVEQIDQEDGVLVDDLVIDADLLDERRDPALAELLDRSRPRDRQLSNNSGGVPVAVARAAGRPVRAVPYFLWANRELGPMRVWLPVG